MALIAKAITKERIVSFIMERLHETTKAGNSHDTDSIIQQVRGVIWLFTDKDPGNSINGIRICKLLDIPYRVDGEFVYWGDQI